MAEGSTGTRLKKSTGDGPDRTSATRLGAQRSQGMGHRESSASDARVVLGNLALQRWSSELFLQRKPMISAPGDAEEQEADRVGQSILRKRANSPLGQCPECVPQAPCSSCEPHSVQRNAHRESTEAESSAVRALDAVSSGGDPLPSSDRAQLEREFGHDFSAVRLHTDAEAAESAHELGARAYTVGRDIAFAAGEFAPETKSGIGLLAHELTHVVQQARRGRGGGRPEAHVQRQQMTPSDANASFGPPQPTTSNVFGPPQAVHGEGYDPCSVSVSPLTNYALLAELTETAGYLRARKKGEDSYYDYSNLMRRLVEERRRRIRMGHLWLGNGAQQVPSDLYQLQLGASGSFSVKIVSGGAHAGEPVETSASPLMTPSQFDEFLARNGIPHIDVAEFYRLAAEAHRSGALTLTVPPEAQGALGSSEDLYPPLGMQPSPLGGAIPSALGGSGLYGSPFDLFVRPNLMRNVYSDRVNLANPRSVTGARTQWRGGLPEVALGYGSYGSILTYQDLNRLRANSEVFDFATRGSLDRVVSVTHSIPDASGNVPTAHYLTKFARMTGAEQPGKFNTALTFLNSTYGESLTASELNQRNFLAVPDDHVSLVQSSVQQMTRDSPERLAPLLEALLRERGATVGSTTYTSWNQVQSARGAGLTDAQFAELLEQLAPHAAQRVTGIGMQVAEVIEMQNVRLATQALGPERFNVLAPPDVLEVRRLMATGISETDAVAHVARNSALRGVGFGMGMAAIGGGISLARADEIDPRMLREFGISVGVQGVAGGGEAYLMSSWNNALVQPLLTDAMAAGTVAGANPLVARAVGYRLGGAGVIGGPVSALTTWGQMGLQELVGDADFSDIDYAALGARSAVAGGFAATVAELGPLGYSLYCAGAGTVEAPIVGTAIGFGVGLASYFVIDWVWGDDIEAAVREQMGEQGCTGSAPPSPPSTAPVEPTWQPVPGCFAAGTRVLMPSGDERPIESVRPGEMVLGFDEGHLVACPVRVSKLTQHLSQPCILISTTSGKTLKVTANHPLYASTVRGTGWTEAGCIQAGDRLHQLGAGGALDAVAVEAVAPAEAVCAVFDLSVEECHNFFADRILAHNKNF